MSRFDQFIRELREHDAYGYHLRGAPVDMESLHDLYPQLNDEYVNFIISIGPGCYFSGAMIFFPLNDSNMSIGAWTRQLDVFGVHGYVAIGYDGTTEGCFAVTTNTSDMSIYWIDWSSRCVVKISENFSEWINSAVDRCFSSKIYAAYKNISDPVSIEKVIADRRMVSISLHSLDKKLCRPPGKESDLLPRYNRLTFKVKKLFSVGITEYTVRCIRTKSSVNDDNVEYVSIPISSVSVGDEKLVDCYLFDPFNLPFDEIVVDVSSEINLGSAMRVKCNEIKKYL